MITQERRVIQVWADWDGLGGPKLFGTLTAAPVRGSEVFSFEYHSDWLNGSQWPMLDPNLQFFSGPQYPSRGKTSFGMFLDSAPDRWGRGLMDRREAARARDERRPRQKLRGSDYLLGVYDASRLGALRFKTDAGGPFLDDNERQPVPEWTSLRELEQASLEIGRRDSEGSAEYRTWLRLLVAPGGSLGGARPKAGVRYPEGHLWIAKFPGREDRVDFGLWELLIHRLAEWAGIVVSEADAQTFSTQHHTFLTRRFDRTASGARLHFASAMTLLGHTDGDDASTGASYLELAEFLVQNGADADRDLEQLWRRIVFFICVSNADDHLRNHGFVLQPDGWALSPAYDMNADPEADGLRLNISEAENAQELDLAFEVAAYFRLTGGRPKAVAAEVLAAVKQWRALAESMKVPAEEVRTMERAFRVADAP